MRLVKSYLIIKKKLEIRREAAPEEKVPKSSGEIQIQILFVLAIPKITPRLIDRIGACVFQLLSF